jgi:predicted nucleotide-binding protein
VNKNEKLDALEAQIKEAADGQPENFNLWRQKTGVVLRNVLGDANQLYENFEKIHYSLQVYTSGTPDSEFEKAKQRGVRQAVAVLEAAKLEVEMSGGAPEPTSGRVLGQTVFVVHGHGDARKHETARVLAKLTGNEPIILHEQANGGKTLIEKFEKNAEDVGYAVVLATRDDMGRANGETEEHPRARQNVVFELGFFFGRLGRERVAVLYEEDVELPSDTDGIAYIPLVGDGWKLGLARELDAAGIGVDFTALKSV